MRLKDFCYFSRGERNALLVLLCLIAGTGIAIIHPSPIYTDGQLNKRGHGQFAYLARVV